MIYFPLSAALAALLLPSARIAWRDAARRRPRRPRSSSRPTSPGTPPTSSPPLHHTADNADWRGPPPRPRRPRRLPRRPVRRRRPGLLRRLPRRPRAASPTPTRRYLALMSLPILAIVSVQALISGANANWAAAAHLAALVLATAVLAPAPAPPRRSASPSTSPSPPRCRSPPSSPTAGASATTSSSHRYVGQADLSRHAAEVARANGLDTLVSGNRAMLADFFYTLRDSGLAIYAEPTEGFPPHHYAQKHPLPPGAGDVLYITRTAGGPACRAPARRSRRSPAGSPALGFDTREIFAFRVPRALLVPGRLRPPGNGPPRPPPQPDPRRPAGRLDLLDPLLPRVGGPRRAGDRAAAHRLRALRRQGGGQPRLHPRLAGGARLHLRHPRAGPPAQPPLGLQPRRPPPRPLRRHAGARRAARARPRHVLPHRRGGAPQRHALALHHGQHRQARAHPLRAAAPRHRHPRLGRRALRRGAPDAGLGPLGARRPQPRRRRPAPRRLLGAAPRRRRPDPSRRRPCARPAPRSPPSAASSPSRASASPGRSPSPARPSGPPSSSTCRS